MRLCIYAGMYVRPKFSSGASPAHNTGGRVVPLCKWMFHHSPHTLSLHPRSNQRLHHSCPLFTPFARTSAYQASFFINCAHLWNSLPDYVVCAPSATVRKAQILIRCCTQHERAGSTIVYIAIASRYFSQHNQQTRCQEDQHSS